MKIGFTGSRTAKAFNDKMLEELNKIDKQNDTIIHGGAIGADRLTAQWATDNNVKQEIILPIDKHAKMNYLYRNVEIVTKADKILAYWDGKSNGTAFTMTYARCRNKDITVVQI